MVEKRKLRFFYGYFILIAGCLILAANGAAATSFGVFLVSLLKEFGWTRAATSAATSIGFIVNVLLAIVAGRLTDRFGPRLVISIAWLLSGLGYVLLSQIGAIWQLYLLYALTGFGTASIPIPLMSTVPRWFVKRRGMMTGILVSAAGIGQMIGPPIARWLIDNYNWRTSYIILGLTVFLIIESAAQVLRRDPSQVGQLPYGEEKIEAKSLNVHAVGFSSSEAVRTRQFWIFCAVQFCYLFGTHVILTHIVIHATGLRIPMVSAVNVLAIAGGVNCVSRLIMGRVSDRIGFRQSMTTGLILLALSFSWLLVAKEVWMLYLFSVLFGFAEGSVMTSLSPLVAQLFGLKSLGVIMATNYLFAGMGGFVSPILAGHIFDVYKSYQLAFLISLAFSVASTILISLLKPTEKNERK